MLKYILSDKDERADLREGYADLLKRSNTYRLGAGIGNLASDAITGVKDFANNITFNPLPYDEYARNTYDGIQNLYGNTLDEGLARVGDLFDRSPPRMAGGPMSRNTMRTPRLNRVRASLDENQVMPLNSTDRAYLAGLTKEDFNNDFPTQQANHFGVPVPLDEYPSSHANPHLLSSDFPTQQAYDDAVAEGHLANKEYNIMRSGMDYPVDDYNNREYNIMRHGVDYPVNNSRDRDMQREGMASGAYKTWANQLGRGLISGDMIGEDMNTHGRIHPKLKADLDKVDNRSDWQKWKDSVSGGY